MCFVFFNFTGSKMQLYQSLCLMLDAPSEELDKYLVTAPNKYKVYTIPKRTSGTRVIAHPAKQLKIYQRAVIKILEPLTPIHKAAFAYKKNTGIKQNASQHVKSKYLLKMDFEDFFHSITPTLFFGIFEQLAFELNAQDKQLLEQVLFWNPSKKTGGKLILSIGAPSSPFISNAIMYLFDQSLDILCKQRKVVYTRYADDITFSTNLKNGLFDLPELIREQLKIHFDGQITINEGKTIFTSKAHNRHVTGITLTNDGQLSIGRERKRMIASLIHQFTLGQLTEEDISYLQGMLAFAIDIEPTFKQRMIKKYTAAIIEQIVKAVKVTQ
jgi:RNA-directed DNA polymerase